jgi:hypothetical protein
MTSPTPSASPTLALSTDAQTYNAGDTITVTANYSDSTAAPEVLTITGTATDSSGNQITATTTVTVNTAEQQPMGVALSDSFSDTYTQVSDSAGVAVFTTVATPSA